MNLPSSLHQIRTGWQSFTAPVCPPAQRQHPWQISADSVIGHGTGCARYHRSLSCQTAHRHTPCSSEIPVDRALYVHQHRLALYAVCYPHRVNFEPPRGGPKVHGRQRRQPQQATDESSPPKYQVNHFSHVSHTFRTALRCPSPTTSADTPASTTMSIFAALPSTCQPR